MARRTETVVIGGVPYELTQMGAVDGRRLCLVFAKVCGSIIKHLDAEKLDREALEAVGELLGSVDPGDVEPLWEAFAKHAVARTESGRVFLSDSQAFDEHFAGRFFEMWELFVESAKLNFKDFLDRAFNILPGAASETQ